MNLKSDFFNKLITQFSGKIQFLEDKPEENLESTVKACWFKAAGVPISAVNAMNENLPELNIDQIKILFDLLDQRQKNVPLSYLTGRQHFMGIEMLIDPRALIPRKETELLGRKALEISLDTTKEKGSVTIIDVCCGAGNLGLAVAFYNEQSKIIVCDLSHDAVALASDNISFLKLNERVEALESDLFSALNEHYHNSVDLIICNPPYISSSKLGKMHAEIAEHEPSLAFDGGLYGTTIIQRLLTDAPEFLSKSGSVVFEVGLGQGAFIIRLCEELGYNKTEGIADKNGNIRVIHARQN